VTSTGKSTGTFIWKHTVAGSSTAFAGKALPNHGKPVASREFLEWQRPSSTTAPALGRKPPGLPVFVLATDGEGTVLGGAVPALARQRDLLSVQSRSDGRRSSRPWRNCSVGESEQGRAEVGLAPLSLRDISPRSKRSWGEEDCCQRRTVFSASLHDRFGHGEMSQAFVGTHVQISLDHSGRAFAPNWVSSKVGRTELGLAPLPLCRCATSPHDRSDRGERKTVVGVARAALPFLMTASVMGRRSRLSAPRDLLSLSP